MLAALISFSGILAPLSRPAEAQACDDVKFIFARGSGEVLGDTSVTAWRTNIDQALRQSTLKYSFYELGTYAQNSYRYPAVSVGGSVSGFGNLLGAYISRGEFFEFGQSVHQGAGELKAYLHTMSFACPRTKFVLGGYSQGAMVLSRTLDELDASRIIYVATFGDPKLYLPEGKGPIPPACLGKFYSSYREHVPDCHAYEGVLGSYRPYQPPSYEDKIGAWCNARDIMCSSGANTKDHTSYASGGLYVSAARKIKSQLKQTFPQAFATAAAQPWANLVHNVAILFDSSVSMNLYLGGHRPAAEKFAAEVLDHGGSVAVAEFRDLDDPYAPRIDCDFSCDQTAVNTSIQRIHGDGGGDDPESALSALLYTMNHLDWQPSAAKSIILVTDNTYHAPDRDGTTLAQVVQRSLEIDPVNLYVVTRKSTQTDYQDLTAQTNGDLFDINDSSDWEKLSDILLYRPAATLNSAEYSGTVGDEFYFDASSSEASDFGNLRYDWDLDADGVFEIVNGPAMLSKTYSAEISGFIQVKVTDAQNRSSTMSAHLVVTNHPPVLPEIYSAASEQLDASTYRIQYQTNAERLLVAIDDSPVGYVDGTDQNFTLTDITSPNTLHLVPYTSSVGRGTGVTLTFGTNLPPTPDKSPDENSPQNPDKIPSENPSQNPAGNSSDENLASPPQSAVIPKAPNAGVTKSSPTSASH